MCASFIEYLQKGLILIAISLMAWPLKPGVRLTLIFAALPVVFTVPDSPPIQFTDVAINAGVNFVLRNAATPERHQIEPMVGGVALFDYNNDNRPDIYFVNGADQPGLDKSNSSFYNRLYRNNGDSTFTDVTLSAAVRGVGFATGVAAADYDNDGFGISLWQASTATSYTATAATARSRTSPRRPVSRMTLRAGSLGLSPLAGSITTTMETSTCSSSIIACGSPKKSRPALLASRGPIATRSTTRVCRTIYTATTATVRSPTYPCLRGSPPT